MGWGSFVDKVKDVAKDVGDYASGHAQKKLFEKGTDAVSDAYKGLSGETAREEASAAAEELRLDQLDELGYLKEINKLPQQYKEEALTKLRDLTTPEGQQAMIAQTKESPFYKELMAGREAGEEGVMRAASVTGGLRSGNVNEALYDYNTQLENRALTQGYDQQVSGLEGLAGIRTNEDQIANTMNTMSTNAMQSRIAQAQMKQQGTANLMNFGLGIGGLLL